MPSANCFDAPTLRNYLLGKLSDEQSDVVAAHLEACLNCEATVAELDRASDTLTSGLRLPALALEPATDDALQRVLEKVQSFEPAAEHREPSRVVEDRSPILRDYRLLEPLGSGGMGQVYKAVHTRLDRLVAVKLLPARRLGDEQAVSRFQREMRVIGQLSHPAIVQATDAGEVDGTHFLVMEYVEGCDLNTLAKACGPLSIADACEIARQAAGGLEYAHQQGIVHRDIKPSNLMLSVEQAARLLPPTTQTSMKELGQASRPSYVKILDLGLALLSGVQAPVDELTTVGQLMGTLDYMAPEQLEDSHLVGPRADIYALAATLYRLLTGFAPFAKDDRKTPLQKLRALATQSAPPIRERRADIPEALAAIIDRALCRESAARFASMNDFADALAPWCAGHDLGQLVGHVSNVPGPAVDMPSLRNLPRSHVRQNVGDSQHGPRARRGSPDPAAWLDRRSPSVSARDANAGSHSGDLRSASAAGSGDPRRALEPHRALDGQVENLPHKPRRTLLVALAFLFFAALGIVITIETNKGTLIVESLREGVEVRVKKSGKMVEEFELTTGPKSARLAAGEYEIEFVGEADGLQIQNGKFVLKRGDTVVAKVTERPKGQSVTTKTVRKELDQPAEPQPHKPVEIVDRSAKGMETFEASNPDMAGEKKVRDILLKNISIAFQDVPLTDVLKSLEDKTQIRFFLETESLNEEGIGADTPITLSLTDKPATAVLKFLLRPIQLAWYIDSGQVVVTTAARARDFFVTRTYPVGKLLPGVRQAVERLKSEPPQFLPNSGQGGFGGGGGGGYFQVRGTPLLVGTLPVAFGQFGGGGPAPPANLPQELPAVVRTEASHFQDLLTESLGHTWLDRDGEGGTCELLHNVLVVRNTRAAQADVESLLRTIEAAFLKPLTEPAEIRPAGYSLEADANVRRQLARKFDVAFTETPLTDVTEWLSNKFEVPVWLDREAFTEEGIATDWPVTLQFQGISGDVLLSRLLKPLQLAHDIEHGVLVITTGSRLKERLVTKVYDVRDLLARGLHPNDPIRGLETTTSGPWLVKDGEGGTITNFADTLLVIRQTSPNHDEVAKFLTSLRSHLSDQPEVPRVIKTRPKTPLAAQPNQPTPSEPKPTTPAPVQPTADNQPRYEGKTFDEWLTVLDVERSPARLTDALEALRLLGDQSRLETVAERVLKVFRVVEIPQTSGGADPSTAKLLTTAQRWFKTIRVAVLQKVCADELRSGTVSSRKFILLHISPPHDGLTNLTGELAKAMLAATQDTDPKVRESALKWVLDVPLDDRATQSRTILETRLREVLKEKVGPVTMLAAAALRDSEADTPAVVNALRLIIDYQQDDPLSWANSFLRFEAVKQAAMMGPRAAPAAKVIARVLLEPRNGNSHSLGRGAGSVMAAPRMNSSTLDLMFEQWAAVALARFGKAAAETLATIKEALKKQSSERDSLDDPRTLPKRDSFSVSLYELLLATEARLEEKPPLDLSNPAEIKIANEDLVLAQANWKLLRVEQELLKQHHGTDAENPTLRELDQKVKAAEEQFQKIQDIYRARPKGTDKPLSTKTGGDGQPKFQGRTLTQWVDDAVATEKIPPAAITALTRDASAEELEPLLIRCLQAINTERSSQGLKTNAQILALIGRKHFSDRVTQAFLDLFRQRFEEELRKHGPELEFDQQLGRHYQDTCVAIVLGLRELSPNIVGPLLLRELKEGSLTGRNLALTHVRTLGPVPRQSQLEQLLPLLVPFVTHQATGLTPAWEKHFAETAWAEIGQIATTCSLNADQQRLLVDLAEKAITDPLQLPHPVNDETAHSVFQVLLKLSPKSERLLPAILKLESAPRVGWDKALHGQWTAAVLAQLAEHDPKALPTLIRLLDEDAFSEENNYGEATVTISPRAYAIARIGSLGPVARDALPVLKKQLESKNKAVVTAAEKAIKLIEAAKDEKNPE